MLYDVLVINRGGEATDTVTGSKRYALERRATLNKRGQTARVIDATGRPVTE